MAGEQAGQRSGAVSARGNHSVAKSVWYVFTASTASTITADTLGSSYDTILSVYTGACAALASVPGGCNDDAPLVLQSRVSFAAIEEKRAQKSTAKPAKPAAKAPVKKAQLQAAGRKAKAPAKKLPVKKAPVKKAAPDKKAPAKKVPVKKAAPARKAPKRKR